MGAINALRQIYHKRLKVLRGFRRARSRAAPRYDAASWWDESFYTDGVSDPATIGAGYPAARARYHYASVELVILRFLLHHGIDLEGAVVLDIGSGAGHWLDFYRSLGARRCVGIDLSEQCVAELRGRYRDDPAVEIRKGDVVDFLSRADEKFDVANAVGVLFHVVQDDRWRDALAGIGRGLRHGGLLVASGHFGLLDRVDAQVDARGRVNKRLRSRRAWKRTLRDAGFDAVYYRHNPAYRSAVGSLPENNLLFAVK